LTELATAPDPADLRLLSETEAVRIGAKLKASASKDKPLIRLEIFDAKL
jgi:hypothetical protein